MCAGLHASILRSAARCMSEEALARMAMAASIHEWYYTGDICLTHGRQPPVCINFIVHPHGIENELQPMSWFSPAWFTEAASTPDPHSITIIPCPHESSSHALPTPILRHGPTNPSRGSSASGGYDNQQPSRAPMVP